MALKRNWLKKICQTANIDCQFQHLPFDSLFLSLKLKKIDAVYGGVGITERRKDQVLFSKVLYKMPVGFIYKKNAQDTKKLNIQDPKEKQKTHNIEKSVFFQDKTIGVQQGTIGFELYLKKYFPQAKLKTYASIQDALLDLQNGRIQAVFGDIPVFNEWLSRNKNLKNYGLNILSEEEASEFSEGTGIAVRKEDVELVKKINSAFDKLLVDGTIDKLKVQYGMAQP